MKYKVSDIKHDVRVILAENEDITPFISSEDLNAPGSIATERDILTESMILTAINNVHSVAPREMLADVVEHLPFSATHVDKFGGYSKATLDDDFMRFIMLEDSGWDIPVTEVTDVASDEYKQLHSRFEGIRASVERPAVALRLFFSGTIESLMLEAYPKLTSPILHYIKNQRSFTTESSIQYASIANACYRAAIYLIASLYYVSIKENDMAHTMENQCKQLLGLTDK